MLRIVLIRAGETDFDEQGRIKGTLDVPLNERGTTEIREEIPAFADLAIETLYVSPCQSAQETANVIGRELGLKIRTVDRLNNVDHGLWHGMLVEEVKQRQPRVYRQWQDHPETVCPPQGEPLAAAQARVAEALEKIVRKHRSGTVAIVVPEPLCALAKAWLERSDVGDLWKAECECGGWHLITVGAKAVLESR